MFRCKTNILPPTQTLTLSRFEQFLLHRVLVSWQFSWFMLICEREVPEFLVWMAEQEPTRFPAEQKAQKPINNNSNNNLKPTITGAAIALLSLLRRVQHGSAFVFGSGSGSVSTSAALSHPEFCRFVCCT